MRKLLRPTNDYAPNAILPGDPAVALGMAQELIEGPLMANHARGLWGYTGPAKGATGDGTRSLSIQSTGYGGQSAAAVLTQLAGLGVRRAVRVGTCVALGGSLSAGTGLLVEAAIGPSAERLAGSPQMSAGLLAALPGSIEAGTVASVDTVANARALSIDAVAADGATAGLFAAAEAAQVSVAAALVVVEADGQELDDEQAHAALIELGRAAWRALGAARSAGT